MATMCHSGAIRFSGGDAIPWVIYIRLTLICGWLLRKPPRCRHMPMHAFIDESARRNVYILAAALVNPGDLGELRRVMRSLLIPGAREVHFAKENHSRRRAVADAVARLDLQVHIYSSECKRLCEAARQLCMIRLTEDLVAYGAHRMVLDTRNTLRGADRDRRDQETIRTVLGKQPSATCLTYEHVSSTSEELLWVADVAAWCWGAGGDWRRRIAPVIGLEVPAGKCL